MTRVLVAGAAGFIGRHVVERLLADPDVEVVGTARPSPYRELAVHPRLTWVYGDLTNGHAATWGRQVGPVDHIINLAANADAGLSLHLPLEFMGVNISITGTLLEVARTMPGLRRFIQVSSAEVFGTSLMQMHERSPILPQNPYAASKAASDSLALAYRESFGVPVIVSCTANVFGEGQPEGRFLPTIVRKALADEMVTVLPGVRRFIHAADCADAWAWMLENAPEQWSHCNVAGELVLNHEDFARIVARAAGAQPRVHVDRERPRPGQLGGVALEDTVLRLAGWKHPLGLFGGVERTVAALLLERAR